MILRCYLYITQHVNVNKRVIQFNLLLLLDALCISHTSRVFWFFFSEDGVGLVPKRGSILYVSILRIPQMI
jgi:hypothetical protein